MKWIFLLSCVTLMGSVVYQPPTSFEFEEELVLKLAQKPHCPFSEALSDLIVGISDQTFDQPFFDKIRQREKSEFSGEFIEYWDNGQMKIKAKFINGKVDGHVHGWFPDGNEAFKAFYYENLRVGIHMAFFPKGGPKLRDDPMARILKFDFCGRFDDTQVSKYHMGNLKTFISFKHGVPNGSWKTYDESEKITKSHKYDLGKLTDKQAPP